jgi:hypothetical protein
MLHALNDKDNDMKQVCELLSIIGGVAIGVLSWLYLTLYAGLVPSELSHLQLTLWFGGIGLLMLASIATVQALLLALLVLVSRGPKAIGWVDPAECRNFGSWVSHQWRFFGVGGQQEGFRFLGLEVAFVGNL